ncbi:MAG: hypothetical protein ACRDU8_07925 [Egibacteraceae bacterium]
MAEQPLPPRCGLGPAVVILLLTAALGGGVAFLLAADSRGDPSAPTPSEAASEPAAGTPTASPTQAATAAPSEPSDPPQGRRGQPADVSELAEQVAEIRGLGLRRKVRARVIAPARLADKVSELGFAETDADRTEADERVLVTLRLAEPDLDLRDLLEDLYREQVLGVYVPEEKTLYVRASADQLSPAAKVTTAHEITHALQDRAFDLTDLRSHSAGDSDAGLATLSLIEGDAVLTGQLWAQRHLSSDEQGQAGAEVQGDANEMLARTPDYLRNALFFPYTRGTAFVQHLYAAGGFEAVDAAFDNPPTTTEQILHADAYRAGEEAADVPDAGRPGARWERAETYEFGEFDVGELFRPLGSGVATEAAEGWGGGEATLWTRGRRSAVAVSLTFDSDSDADEACDAVPAWWAEVADSRPVGDGVQAGDGDHLAWRCDGHRVVLGVAPGPAAARRLIGD